jgi:hypothetical protein
MAHVTFVFTQNIATFAFCFPSKRRPWLYAIHTGILFYFNFLFVSTVQRFGKRKTLVGIDQGKKWHSSFLGLVLKVQISLHVAS